MFRVCDLQTDRPTDLLTQTTISKYLTFDVDTGVGFKEAQGHPLEDEVEIGYEGLAVAARKLQQHVQSFQVLFEVWTKMFFEKPIKELSI